MNEKQILAKKATNYIYAYIGAFIVCSFIAVVMFIPVFKIKEYWPYLTTSIIFIAFDLVLIYLIINYLLRPKILISIDKNNIYLYRSKNKTISININDLEDSTITISFFSIFLHDAGALTIKTKNNKYFIGYIKDYIKISGQLNSIKYIRQLGDKK